VIPYRKRPSPGFVYLVLVAVGATAFFAWGLQRPRLEDAWRLDIELSLGRRPSLSRGELNRLQETLVAHPAVGEFLAEDKHAGIFSANDDGKVEGGYAYLVRQSADDPGLLSVEYAGSRKKGSVAVRARTVRARGRGDVRHDRPWTWRLPDDGPFPQLVELRLIPKGKKKQLHPVRIDLRGAP
jgi:hypothetical protein